VALFFLDFFGGGSFSSLLSFSPFLNVIARRGSFLLGAFFQPGKLRLFHLFRIASKKSFEAIEKRTRAVQQLQQGGQRLFSWMLKLKT